MRIQKFLSRTGRASRREAERLMSEGRVRVNGRVVTELGTRVDPDRDEIAVDGRVMVASEARIIVFHKPAGVLTTRKDPHGGRTVYQVLPRQHRQLRYVGRLDRDTEGLLLFTNDGDLANGLLHPSSEVEREYRAWVTGVPDRDTLQRLVSGVKLDDGPAQARRAEAVGAGPDGSELRVVLTEGRKREVRRLLYAVGHPVQRLVRVRYGNVRLGDLPPGSWRRLEPDEERGLRELAGGRRRE
ncbi:MAG: rRNA pseudouridine synthase [Gemmatimonadota bacterium]|nr:rRNA pseudouridine synthase [Gemmatimonadota bacterium]